MKQGVRGKTAKPNKVWHLSVLAIYHEHDEKNSFKHNSLVAVCKSYNKETTQNYPNETLIELCQDLKNVISMTLQ